MALYSINSCNRNHGSAKRTSNKNHIQQKGLETQSHSIKRASNTNHIQQKGLVTESHSINRTGNTKHIQPKGQLQNHIQPKEPGTFDSM